MRCSNMAADSKTEKNLGHNLTVTRLVSLPKTRLRTTTGRYIKSTHFEIVVGSRRVSRVARSIEREALNVVQELYKLSAHNCSKVLGVLLEFCDGRTPNTP